MSNRSPDEQAGKGRIAVHRNALTEVELIWIEGRIEHWTRFGRIAAERIVSRKTRMVSFRPDAVFSLVRGTSNDYGTIHSQIGRPSSRERVCQYVYISVVAVSLQKNRKCTRLLETLLTHKN